MPFPEPTCSQTPDGTYVFEATLPDGTRLAAVVLPEDVDELTGPPTTDPPDADERRRRFQAAQLLAELDLKSQAAEHRNGAADNGATEAESGPVE
jgi:hypothetical protein